jgi:hypothetical protein
MPHGIVGPKLTKDLKLGNIILTDLPFDKAEAMEFVDFCRENGIYFIFSELVQRGCFDIGNPWGHVSTPEDENLRTDDGAYGGYGLPHGHDMTRREDFYSKEELEEIVKAGGKYYIGRMSSGEVGGILYWMREYVFNRKCNSYENLPAVETVDQAKAEFLDVIRKRYAFERTELGGGPIVSVESSALIKYVLEGGADTPVIEMIVSDPSFVLAAFRGACRAYGKETFGAHVAMGWYGGISLDEMWQKRWKNSLYVNFIFGADAVYPETGHLTYHHMGKNVILDSPEMLESRRILREFNQFAQIHSRPAGGPKAKLGLVYGNLDGYHGPGFMNRSVWSQEGAKWEFGPAEFGWECINTLERRAEWNDQTMVGSTDYSGNPPYGVYDIMPIEASQEILNSYSGLAFVGWNTMTDEIYGKLKTYVEQGGHLFMSVPHLSTETDRAKDLNLYKDGDFSDLFGVKIKGRGISHIAGAKCFADSSIPSYRMPHWILGTDPLFTGHLELADTEVCGARVLSGYSVDFQDTIEELSAHPIITEFNLGKGTALLLNSWTYPGDHNWAPLFKDMLAVISDGEQGDIRLIGNDRVRYSVYDGHAPNDPASKIRVVYLLNLEYDIPQLVRLWINGKTTPLIAIAPSDMKVVYIRDGVVLSPDDRGVEMESWSAGEVSMFARIDNTVRVFNTSDKPVVVSLNGESVSLAPGDEGSIDLKKKADPERPEFYADDYLSEPTVAELSDVFPNGDTSVVEELVY